MTGRQMHDRTRRMARLSPLRANRLKQGLPLTAVAFRAGLTLTRASQIEREPSLATPAETAAMRAAVALLVKEQGVGSRR